MNRYQFSQLKNYHQILLIIAVILISFNLRAAITSVGPVIGLFREQFALSNWSIGILTSLPLLAFAVMSPLVSKISSKFANETTLVIGMVILSIGLLVRSIAFLPLLFVGTILIGMGIAVSNVLLPGIIKERFPHQIPLLTGVYTTAMSLSAAISSVLVFQSLSGLIWGGKLHSVSGFYQL